MSQRRALSGGEASADMFLPIMLTALITANCGWQGWSQGVHLEGNSVVSVRDDGSSDQVAAVKVVRRAHILGILWRANRYNKKTKILYLSGNYCWYFILPITASSKKSQSLPTMLCSLTDTAPLAFYSLGPFSPASTSATLPHHAKKTHQWPEIYLIY